MERQVEQQQQQRPPQEQQGWRPSFMQILIGFIVGQWLIGQLTNSNNRNDPNLIHNTFAPDDYYDLTVKIVKDKEVLYKWNEKELQYNYDEKNFLNQTFSLTKEQVFTRPYPKIIVSVNNLNRTAFIINSGDLVVQEEKIVKAKRTNLISSALNQTESPETPQKNVTKGEKAPHFRERFFIQFIHDTNSFHPQQIPPQMKKVITVNMKERTYEPLLDVGQFWVRRQYLIYENQPQTTEDEESTSDSSTELIASNNDSNSLAERDTYNTTISFYPYWYAKLMMIVQLEETFKQQSEWGLNDNSSIEQFKEILGDNNPYYLALTFAVSLLHSLFELLAVKNDISYWSNLQNYQGLSLRSLYTSLLFEGVILLYLFDSPETSWMILASSSIELLVTIWKIFKTAKCRSRADRKFPFFEIDHQNTYVRTTEEHDKTATKYLYISLFPLLVGYTIYSLIYEEHKGWYSFIISTLVGFIYLFGFINMTPQLYINYKLKSVEHLPWRTMIYKFLNTIVDDLFAFVITMPWLKRLSCFRDDIIFLIYIYQRQIYKVDTKRTEHGFKKEDLVPVNKGHATQQAAAADAQTKKTQ